VAAGVGGREGGRKGFGAGGGDKDGEEGFIRVLGDEAAGLW
jgi:hypothetical protein